MNYLTDPFKNMYNMNLNRLVRAYKALVGQEEVLPDFTGAAVNEMNRWLADMAAYESPEIPDPRNPKDLPKLLTGIAARAVMVKAQAVASRPLHLYRLEGDEKTEVKDHPVLDRLRTPNWNMTLSDLLTYSVMWLEINGNAYWLYIGDGDERGRGFWPMVPWQVRIVPKTKTEGPWDLIDSYEFEGWGVPRRFSPDKIWHVKYPNPADPYLYGRPPLADCAAGLTVLDLMYKHNIYGLAAGGFPAVAAVLSADGDPQEVGALIKRMKDEMRYAFAGYRGTRSIGVFPPGTELKSIGASEKDMEFYQGHQIMVEQILAILGVPASKLGLVKDVNRANAEANDLTFQGEVVQPLCGLLAQALTADWLWIIDPASAREFYFEFEPTDLSDREFELKKTEMYLRQGILLPNEVRAEAGMGDRPDGGGDRPVYVEEAEARIGLAPSPAKGEAPHIMAKQHVSHDNQLLSYRIVWGRMVNSQAVKWRRHVQKAFSGAEGRAREYVKNHNLPDMALIMDFVFPHRAEQIVEMAKSGAEIVLASRDVGRDLAGKWAKRDRGIEDLLRYDSTEQMAIVAGAARVRKDWDATDILWATERGERLADILWDGIMGNIARLGITEDGELGDLVAAVVATGERIEGVNSLALARTEATREINGGLFDGYREQGIGYKQWNAVGDAETREDHFIADGQIVAMDEDFIVGGESAPYPGYDGLSEEQVINCRCVALPYEAAPISGGNIYEGV